MRKEIILFTTFFKGLSIIAIAQEAPKLSIRLGASRLINTSGGNHNGFAFKKIPLAYPYPLIGLEYSKPQKKQGIKKIAGFILEPVGAEFETNTDKINAFSTGVSTGRVSYSFKIYGGIEKRIGIKSSFDRPGYKNTFSWFAGLGLVINGSTNERNHMYRFNPPFSGIYGETGTTRDGRIYKGWESFTKAEYPVSPTVFGGFRWNIRNNKGNEVVQLELSTNYGLIPYFNYHYKYSLNDIPQVDKFPERGFSIQFSVFIPVKKFMKGAGKFMYEK